MRQEEEDKQSRLQKQHSQRLLEAECEDDIDEDESAKHAPHSEQVPPLKGKHKHDQDPFFKQALPHSSVQDIVLEKPLSGSPSHHNEQQESYSGGESIQAHFGSISVTPSHAKET